VIGHLCCLPIESELIFAILISTLKMEVVPDHRDIRSLHSLVKKGKCANKHWYNQQDSIKWHI